VVIWSHLHLLAGLALGLHALGIVTAVHAVMKTRTSQGAIAWAFALVTLPYGALPFYWVFGRDRFMGYVKARQKEGAQIDGLRAALAQKSLDVALLPSGDPVVYGVFDRLAQAPFVAGNTARLLVDGNATFDAIFAGIDAAKSYVLVQFFIVHDDQIGKQLQARLIAKARQGVKVFFLYDEIGSHALPKRYLRELREASVEARPFLTSRDFRNRFQINFRNHRKIVVVDGKTAYVGGHNVGDEYMGRDPHFGHWRDTHVCVSGPAAMAVQLCFLDDWHWSTTEVPQLAWNVEPQAATGGAQPRAAPEGQAVLVLPSGPVDRIETYSLFFVHAIQSAKQRVWITSPYFVPDPSIISALQIAVLRGVDVRVMLPSFPDHWISWLASFSYLKDVLPWGVKMFRYQGGFLHQKVLLVDDGLASVGTANLDLRSLRLNFEITLLFAGTGFAGEVARMLEADFAQCKPLLMAELNERSVLFRLAVQLARLLAPAL
jgi:cardiolipin synthase